MSDDKYKKIQIEADDILFFCIKCDVLDNFVELPYSYLTDEEIFANNLDASSTSLKNLNISLEKRDKETIQQITYLIENSLCDEEKTISCKYYNIEKFNKAKFKKDKYLSFLHLNIASLQAHIDELKILLQLLNFEFDVIGISETKLIKNEEPVINISLPNYTYVHTPSEAQKGGTLLYISNRLTYKLREDLQIYES